jgi:hypothetical protein
MPDLTGYRVKRKTAINAPFETIATLPATQTTYIDNSPVVNVINFYTIAALYETLESGFSNEVSLFNPSPTLTKYQYDNGVAITPSTGYNGTRVNKFSPNIHPSENRYKVVAIEFFIQQRNAANILDFVLYNQNEHGFPGEIIHDIRLLAAETVDGWNFLVLPDIPVLEFTSGSFFAGFNTIVAHSRIGISNNTNGMTYMRTPSGTEFTILPTGVLMIRAWVDRFTGDIEIVEVPTKLSAVNYPNPFNPETIISFNLPRKDNVSVKIFNVKGQLVNTLLNKEMEAGENTVTWTGNDNNGNPVGSGVYFYQIQTTDESIVNRMMLMK